MKFALLLIFVAIGLVDGILNIKQKLNLGQLLFHGRSVAVKRWGSTAFYVIGTAVMASAIWMI